MQPVKPNFDPAFRELEETLLTAIEERLAAQKPKWWLPLLPVMVSALLVAIIIPWGSWVTRSISELEKHDSVFDEWKEGIPTVLKNHRLETLSETTKEVTVLIENRFGKIEGKLDTLTKQAVENGYDVRRMSELFDLHLRQDGVKKPTSSYFPTWPSDTYRSAVRQYVVQTNKLHIPSGTLTKDTYAALQ